jgi:hypothetical protein
VSISIEDVNEFIFATIEHVQESLECMPEPFFAGRNEIQKTPKERREIIRLRSQIWVLIEVSEDLNKLLQEGILQNIML